MDLAAPPRARRSNGRTQARAPGEWLRSAGDSRDKARELRRVWRAREWVMPTAAVLGKPLCLSEYSYALLLDLPTASTEGPRQPTEGEN